MSPALSAPTTTTGSRAACAAPAARAVLLCRARSLTYITTAGGAYDPRFSFDYLTAMAKKYFGIRETRLIYAEYLDICGNDPEAILQAAIDQIERSADR